MWYSMLNNTKCVKRFFFSFIFDVRVKFVKRSRRTRCIEYCESVAGPVGVDLNVFCTDQNDDGAATGIIVEA